MRKKLLLLMFLGMTVMSGRAQRTTDVIDRGLVAVKTGSGIFCSWRVTAEEYYDVTYNIYRDGTKINTEPLSVSNFTDKSGTVSSKYAVEAVVRGKAQVKSSVVTPWAKNYKEIKMNHGTLTSTYIPNDACVADVDGDGELEILLKFDNASDAANSYKPAGHNGEYAIIEVYKLDGTKLWWIDLGPNMADFQNNENNIVAYDWDGDGKAEALLRAADGTTIHMADGTTHVVGDKTKNYRAANGYSGQWFIHDGAEYLLYLNGHTGAVYQQMEYPLKRLESGETDLNKAWGDGYGHRSTKHFFGAPYLDGRKPSIFLARGIYTRHKMIALDVDPATHKLTERWRWNCNTAGSQWYGQGYHNFGIADVDWDGRDEIVFGSMVIDDNGKGLSTTGLGHGDSQHCSDFDPYSHGQEIFACNEDRPNNNFRDATTSKIYYRTTGGNDDGRANMGNFYNNYPGAQGVSSRDGSLISSVTHAAIPGGTKSNITQNFRIYWDGDLCSETFDYANGKNTAGTIYKVGKGAIATLEGSMTNNDTKGTPCYQGDILGDWREEVIMRTADNNIRIYTTNVETKWRNYTLWHDHQYRQAMVWQMCGYNQTPHVSYFLGELEGITKAPAPLTMTGRTEIVDGSTIGTAENDKHIIMCKTGDMTVNVADGASPYILTVNAPTWVQGHDNNNNITTTTYAHTVTGGAFGGSMRLVKQGDGVLNLPAVTQTYTGPTEVWAGTVNFDGTLQSSRLWLNRFASLVSDGGKFMKGIQADYGATIVPGGRDNKGNIEADSLILNFGSTVLIDLYGEDVTADIVKARVLTIEKKNWTGGPEYNTPVLRFVKHVAAGESNIANGRYLIGEFGTVVGNIADFKVEGLNSQKSELSFENGKLYITITNFETGSVTWTGNVDGVWNIDGTPNFIVAETGVSRSFVPGDDVIFDDSAVSTDIIVSGHVAPASIVFNNSEKNFTITGDSIVGGGELVKNGTASVTVNSINRTGKTTVNGGKLTVSAFANEIGQEVGSLGTIDKTFTLYNNAALSLSATATSGQKIFVGEGGGQLDIPQGVTLTLEKGVGAIGSGTVLTKTGTGTLNMGGGNSVSKLVIERGVVNASETNAVIQLPATVELRGGTLYDPASDYSYSTNNVNFVVPENCTGTFYSDPRCNYKGRLTGSGTFRVYGTGIRDYFQGNWSQFEGTVIPGVSKRGSYDPDFTFDNSYGLPKATLQMDAGVTFNNNGKNVEIGNVTGSGTLAGSGTYIIGTNGADIRFRGAINSAVQKKGAGIWYLTTSGKLENAKTITVNEGMLYIDTYNSTTSVTGSKGITVNGGASVKGTGTLGALVLNGGAELTPGRTTTDDVSGFVATQGALTANAESVVNLNIKGKANSNSSRSFLKVGTALTLNGVLNVTLSSTYIPAQGDEIVLWTAASFNGDPVINLPVLPLGLKWDDSDLLNATGILRVLDDPTGISSVMDGGKVKCRVYTFNGIYVCDFECYSDDVITVMRSKGLAGGTYIVRVGSDTGTENIKIVIK